MDKKNQVEFFLFRFNQLLPIVYLFFKYAFENINKLRQGQPRFCIQSCSNSTLKPEGRAKFELKIQVRPLTPKLMSNYSFPASKFPFIGAIEVSQVAELAQDLNLRRCPPPHSFEQAPHCSHSDQPSGTVKIFKFLTFALAA